jgi:hypothetical protein
MDKPPSAFYGYSEASNGIERDRILLSGGGLIRRGTHEDGHGQIREDIMVTTKLKILRGASAAAAGRGSLSSG